VLVLDPSPTLNFQIIMNPASLTQLSDFGLPSDFELRLSDFILHSPAAPKSDERRSFDIRPSQFIHPSNIPSFHHSSHHFWRTEPPVGVDPILAQRRPSFAVQHILCLARTGEALGMTRRVPGGFYRTAWFSCGQIKTKRHVVLKSAKNFLERTFTRTIPKSIQRPDPNP